MKTALVLGAGGFIGSHLVNRLKEEGFWVRGVDLKHPDFSFTQADDFIIGDLRSPSMVSRVMVSPFQTSLESGNGSFETISKIQDYIKQGESFDYKEKEEKFLFIPYKTKETYREHIIRLIKEYLSEKGVL